MKEETQNIYEYLLKKYNRATINKKELAQEMNISISTIDSYISSGTGIPKYKKATNAKNARLLFNIYNVATYLTSNQIETM
jgi:transposase